MNWDQLLHRWLGHGGKNKKIDLQDLESKLKKCDGRVKCLCQHLGGEVDREAVSMLVLHGYEDEEVEELVSASNILSHDGMSDIDHEVEKMYAEGILQRYGYEDITTFQEELNHFKEAHHAKN
ncbi:MAG: hypothetical protein JNK65_00420 [Deltaproteobacteria bacterium]|nr:hypothetical protein [Deltaproteobacteria bacterium]